MVYWKAGPMAIETSVIIRTKNEKKWIEVVLEKIFAQTYQNFEVIVIDSGSIDQTLEIIKKFPVKLLNIPAKDFSYPYALNYAIKHSAASSKYIVIISAHSLPVSNTWLADGLENFQKFPKIMGVYGLVKALPDSHRVEKVFYRIGYHLNQLQQRKRQMIVTKSGMGVMGNTSSILLKNLWERRPFNESYGMGGEDGEWADYWMKKGYRAIRDIKFSVLHSHNLGWIGSLKQFRYWQSVGKPRPFTPLKFRKDETHNS